MRVQSWQFSAGHASRLRSHSRALFFAMALLALALSPSVHAQTEDAESAPDSWKIQLRVIDLNGRPISGATLSFDVLGGIAFPDAERGDSRVWRTGADGSVQLEMIDEIPRQFMDHYPPLLVEKPGFLPGRRFLHLEGNETRTVDLGNVVLSPSAAVHIVAKTAQGKLVPDAFVRLDSRLDEVERLTGTTDEKGAIRFPVVAPGVYDIFVEARGLAAIVEQHRVVLGDETVLPVVVSQRGMETWFGRVLYASGSACSAGTRRLGAL